MSTKKNAFFFYQFLGAHSLLIGLLPFFLPVYLWTHGVGLAGLCILIGMSGLGFVSVLGIWQRIWSTWHPRRLITTTFALEVFLVACVGWFTTIPGSALFDMPESEKLLAFSDLLIPMCVIGIANGIYNAFFWTTQRSLFLQQLGENDTGKQYGNFQIFVTVFLKVGILLGGLLLDFGGFVGLLGLSAGISFAANTYLSQKIDSKRAGDAPSTSLRQSISYSDSHGSKPVFAVDGLFLYFESHFWTLSLFLLVKQDYSTLGIAVILLALVFAAMFYLIKNRIDGLPVERVYQCAVWLYAFSWLLRFTLEEEANSAGYLIALVLITFCSSFFRLAFNKRFFDVALRTGNINYLLIKSYSSQLFLGVFFLVFGLTLSLSPLADVQSLQYSYLFAALLSLVYLRYRDQ